MRVLFWFLLLAIAAVVAALAAKLNNGYALLVAPPYRIELSLNLLIILIVGSFVSLYLGLRIIVHTVRLPSQVREWRRQMKQARSRAKLDAATIALLEGRYGKAQQQADEALAFPRASGVAALVGARAALDVRQYAGAEEFLARTGSDLLNTSRFSASHAGTERGAWPVSASTVDVVSARAEARKTVSSPSRRSASNAVSPERSSSARCAARVRCS